MAGPFLIPPPMRQRKMKLSITTTGPSAIFDANYARILFSSGRERERERERGRERKREREIIMCSVIEPRYSIILLAKLLYDCIAAA